MRRVFILVIYVLEVVAVIVKSSVSQHLTQRRVLAGKLMHTIEIKPQTLIEKREKQHPTHLHAWTTDRVVGVHIKQKLEIEVIPQCAEVEKSL